MAVRQEPNEPLGLLIKPASGDCNLACQYCFYLRSSNVYPEAKKHRMSEKVLEEMIKQTLETNHPVASFAWQGGEPLLMGLEFFEKAVELMKNHGKGHSVSNGLQTNGILLDEKWAKFFVKYHFLLGVSLDGPKSTHDKFRPNTFDRVWQGIEALRENKVEFNILTVVNSDNATRPEEVYDFFTSSGLQHLQFIPCMEETEALQKSSPCTITPEQYGEFLCRLFDRWIKDGYPDIHVRFFDNVLEHYLGLVPGSCQMRDKCGAYVVIEYNGDVFPCDFFVYPEWKLGNIFEKPLGEIVKGDLFKKFADSKVTLRKRCRRCRWIKICCGGCSRTRYFRRQSFSDLDYFCKAYQTFFEHSADRLKDISKRQGTSLSN